MARDRKESGYKGPDLAMQLLLYPETALPFTTPAGSENCTGYYLETSGVLLFAWNLLPQGQVSFSLSSEYAVNTEYPVVAVAAIDV